MATLSSSPPLSIRFLSPPSLPKNRKSLYSSRPPPRTRNPTPPISSSLKLGVEEIALITHNKALVAAAVASAIGQLAKPLTSALLGDGINLRSLVQPGGMPSTHSASVVAAATTIGLERGFSDSVFGMSVVFAAIVMYDAQGVRREAGKHAKVLNRILKAEEASVNSKPGTSSRNTQEIVPLLTLSEKANPYTSKSESYSLQDSKIASRSAMPSLKVDNKAISEKIYSNYSPLTERLGHTELEVLFGALLGFVVSLMVGIIL
ncbi:Uncharacterized protein M6B38_239015 [Iris pallida]|uniref:Membrane protein YuiD n=1 Tax=Iris pallida TaxID=29817 RepID=A0AAX6DKL8_IRIPA|nr:Uncharacterized protein M6B38_239015 [Iris pallida]